jgi:hypothetical protein
LSDREREKEREKERKNERKRERALQITGQENINTRSNSGWVDRVLVCRAIGQRKKFALLVRESPLTYISVGYLSTILGLIP